MRKRQFRVIHNLASITKVEQSPVYQRNKQHFRDPLLPVEITSSLPKIYQNARHFGIFLSGEKTLQQTIEVQKMQQLKAQLKANRKDLYALDRRYEHCYNQMLSNENKVNHIFEMMIDSKYELYDQ